jgi:hypothetical protein
MARRRRLRLERRLLDLGPQRERRDLLLVGQPRLLQPRLGRELLELALLARRLSLRSRSADRVFPLARFGCTLRDAR